MTDTECCPSNGLKLNLTPSARMCSQSCVIADAKLNNSGIDQMVAVERIILGAARAIGWQLLVTTKE